jgi:Ca-activated chloride channel family protein
MSLNYASVIAKQDKETLKKIAEITGGRYFRAEDMAELQETYGQISELEYQQK